MTRLRRLVLAFATCVAVSLIGVASCAMSGALVPLPPPTGKHPVGTMQAVLTGGLAVALWYPARDTASARRAAYRPDDQNRTMRERLLFSLVRPAGFLDAAVAAGKFPVVLYIPGWGDTRSDNTALCEELASHGFIVAAMNDIAPNPAMDFSTEEAFHKTVSWANTKVRDQARAAGTLLTGLQTVKPGDAVFGLTRAMDFERVAALGFSFGGATAAEIAQRDPRVRAAIDLDGWTFGDAAVAGVPKPFMIVGTGSQTLVPPVDGTPAQESNPYEALLDVMNQEQIVDGFRRHGGYYVTIDGTQHEDYCDAGLYPRLHAVPRAIDARRAQRIVATYTVHFLDLALNGTRTPLLTPRLNSAQTQTRSEFDAAALVTIWLPPGKPMSNT